MGLDGECIGRVKQGRLGGSNMRESRGYLDVLKQLETIAGTSLRQLPVYDKYGYIIQIVIHAFNWQNT